MLHRALQRAVKSGGLKVFMTATPAPSMLQAARRGGVHLITVPVRHHGYPVPVPKVILCRRHLVPEHWEVVPAGMGRRYLNFPGILAKTQIQRCSQRVFVFVPRIWLVRGGGWGNCRLFRSFLCSRICHPFPGP